MSLVSRNVVAALEESQIKKRNAELHNITWALSNWTLRQNVDQIVDLKIRNVDYAYLVYELQQMPIYVFGESYGGKMAAHFANRLFYVSACLSLAVFCNECPLNRRMRQFLRQ